MLKPCKLLENTILTINQVFSRAQVPYWLAFGALYGIVKNDGIIPDGDLDLCTYHGQGFERVQKAFLGSPARYGMSKALISDTTEQPLYCSFGSENGYPHICLSFWYEHEGIVYYCHDQRHEVEGVGVPKSGYWFRGVPIGCIKEFHMVEWPGIPQTAKIRVPMFAGTMLDNMYPYWAFKKQKYNIGKNNEVIPEKMDYYYTGGATSPYEVHVESMKQWGDKKYIEQQLQESLKKWNLKLKNI